MQVSLQMKEEGRERKRERESKSVLGKERWNFSRVCFMLFCCVSRKVGLGSTGVGKRRSSLVV